MYNGEYISRVLDVYQKGSTNKESVLRVLKDIPLTTNEADNYKIISITDKVTNSIIQSEVWDETNSDDLTNLNIMMNLSTRTLVESSPHEIGSELNEEYLTNRLKEYESSIVGSSSPSKSVLELLGSSVSGTLSTLINGGSWDGVKFTNSELPLASKIEAFMGNNITQSLGNAARDAFNDNFDSSRLLRNLSNDLPSGLGSIMNRVLRAYDYSAYEQGGASTSNPNKPKIQVDAVVCWIKDLAKPETPPFEILHQPAGFSDSISHNFSSTEIMGRTSPIMGYSNSSRSVGFEFTVHEDYQPFSIEETVQYLKGMTYPDYDINANRIIPPKTLITVGQFSEVVVLTSVDVNYQANPVRDGKYIVATIRVGGTVVPSSEGTLEYKSLFYKDNSYANNLAALERGTDVLQSLTNTELLNLNNRINEFLAPINSKVNELGTLISSRSKSLLSGLMSKATSLLGVVMGKKSGVSDTLSSSIFRNNNVPGSSSNSASFGGFSIGGSLSNKSSTSATRIGG
jgi:hypothetical protein